MNFHSNCSNLFNIKCAEQFTKMSTSVILVLMITFKRKVLQKWQLNYQKYHNNVYDITRMLIYPRRQMWLTIFSLMINRAFSSCKLIKLTRRVCRGLPCYAAFPEKQLFIVDLYRLPSHFNQFSYHARMFVLCQRSLEAISQYPKPQKKDSHHVNRGI